MANDILNTTTMFTKKEVAKMLRCCIRTVEYRVKAGMLKPTKMGRHVLFSVSDNPVLAKIKK